MGFIHTIVKIIFHTHHEQIEDLMNDFYKKQQQYYYQEYLICSGQRSKKSLKRHIQVLAILLAVGY